jgi:hypothetical protein
MELDEIAKIETEIKAKKEAEAQARQKGMHHMMERGYEMSKKAGEFQMEVHEKAQEKMSELKKEYELKKAERIEVLKKIGKGAAEERAGIEGIVKDLMVEYLFTLAGYEPYVAAPYDPEGVVDFEKYRPSGLGIYGLKEGFESHCLDIAYGIQKVEGSVFSQGREGRKDRGLRISLGLRYIVEGLSALESIAAPQDCEMVVPRLKEIALKAVEKTIAKLDVSEDFKVMEVGIEFLKKYLPKQAEG